ncbi:pantetheine hydrolase VNN2-like [Palaemon carinicauda]|uniref:pantetheine hydrolase VNN2-like n=1 Tax=Palaemon carinicauda TaxID=392227 RepID=UPI0035B6664C
MVFRLLHWFILVWLFCLIDAQPDYGMHINTKWKNNFDWRLQRVNDIDLGETVQEDTCVGTDVEYVAAALQYEAFDDLGGGGLAVLEQNALKFIEYAKIAKEKGTQIIVFPEHGLTSLNLAPDPEVFLTQTQVVPDPKDREIPCEYTHVKDSSKIMKELSCAAIENTMYLVVDLSEQFNCSAIDSLQKTTEYTDVSSCIFYNTQVVFDEAGAVVARYRKKHLFSRSHFTPGSDPDVSASFETSFGVTFTLMICFDILYETPAIVNFNNLGIRDAIMSTGWMDQLPFLTAPQIWKGFTMGNNVNLVVANLYNPSDGFLGAGIFRGVASEPEEYTYDTSSGTKLIVGSVKTTSTSLPAKRSRSNSEMNLEHGLDLELIYPTEQKQNLLLSLEREGVVPLSRKTGTKMYQKYKHENLSGYNYTVLERSASSTASILNKTVCDEDELCCHVSYSYPASTEPEDFVYMIIAFSGLSEHANYTYFTFNQNCGVVLCLDESISSCGHIEGALIGDSTFRAYELSGTFVDHYVYPSVLTDSLQLFDPARWGYSVTHMSDHYYAKINLHEEVNDLLTLGLYSRVFSKDPEYARED